MPQLDVYFFYSEYLLFIIYYVGIYLFVTYFFLPLLLRNLLLRAAYLNFLLAKLEYFTNPATAKKIVLFVFNKMTTTIKHVLT